MAKAYHTKQQDFILSCLTDGKHRTVAQVIEQLGSDGKQVGAATVYRNLEKMVQDGTVRKFVTGNASPACYQYAGENPRVCADHYHMRCLSCGKLIHLDCDALCDITDHIRHHHNFEIDATKTVFYGKCGDCLASETITESDGCEKESCAHESNHC